jgi:hypothetical protein
VHLPKISPPGGSGHDSPRALGLEDRSAIRVARPGSVSQPKLDLAKGALNRGCQPKVLACGFQ